MPMPSASHISSASDLPPPTLPPYRRSKQSRFKKSACRTVGRIGSSARSTVLVSSRLSIASMVALAISRRISASSRSRSKAETLPDSSQSSSLVVSVDDGDIHIHVGLVRGRRGGTALPPVGLLVRRLAFGVDRVRGNDHLGGRDFVSPVLGLR